MIMHAVVFTACLQIICLNCIIFAGSFVLIICKPAMGVYGFDSVDL